MINELIGTGKQQIIEAIADNDRAKAILENCEMWPIVHDDLGWKLSINADAAVFDQLVEILATLKPLRLEVDRVVVSRDEWVELVLWADGKIRLPE